MKKPEEFLPLGQNTFYIMGSLIPGPQHGYAILKDVERLSDGEVRMAIGNLYVALKRLLDQGLIERVDGPAGDPGDRRKVYKLTGVGELVFQAESDRVRRMAATASRLRPAEQGV